MRSTNRIGRVSAIDYKAGTYSVTYIDRGRSVTRKINAQSNGEYMMPEIGQIVSVSHNSNGGAAAVTTGTVWNRSNKPAEGFKGLYRKEFCNVKGQAFDRYDANTGVFTHYVDKRTGRNCNGDIYDEAKGGISLAAKGQMQFKSSDASASIQGKTGVGIATEAGITIEAGGFVSIESQGALSIAASGGAEITVLGGNAVLNINGVKLTVSEDGSLSIESPTKISMEAPEIRIKGSSGEVKY